MTPRVSSDLYKRVYMYVSICTCIHMHTHTHKIFKNGRKPMKVCGNCLEPSHFVSTIYLFIPILSL